MSRRRTIKEDGPDPIDKQVGANIKLARVQRRLSQTKMGDLVGVTFQQIQKYENGMNRIGASNLFKFKQHLTLEWDDIFQGCGEELEKDGPVLPYNALPDLAETPWVIRATVQLAALKGPVQKNICKLIASLSDKFGEGSLADEETLWVPEGSEDVLPVLGDEASETIN